MKITRYKRAQRYLSFYRNHFDFHPPYQVLLDGTFCQAALKNKVNIAEQMPKYLNDQVKLLTTVCCVNEVEKFSSALYGAMLIIKQFAVHKCGHEKNPISAKECLYSFLRKSKAEHYFLATQDQSLTEKIRKLSFVPLIYLKLSTIVLEKPPEKALALANVTIDESVDIESHQLDTLKQLKQIEFGPAEEGKKRKRKGPKGPNPLSCKKKKDAGSKANGNSSKSQTSDGPKDNRRKRKKRIPNHIKRMFTKIETELYPGAEQN